jgi:flagellar biosynthesis/type III secretory pathway chaperone
MTASRPSYAPSSARRCLPATQRLRLRLRQRARRGWSVQTLLDERRQLLAALEALKRARATVATTLRRQAIKKPAARDALAQADRTAQATIERHAERLRHRLLLDDGILSSHGVRPWEQDTNPP